MGPAGDNRAASTEGALHFRRLWFTWAPVLVPVASRGPNAKETTAGGNRSGGFGSGPRASVAPSVTSNLSVGGAGLFSTVAEP
jgi:hypothetical protein